jgi:serine protease Do
MTDPLRAKLNLILTALVAFGIGLGIAARFDLTPHSLAGVANPPLRLEPSGPSTAAPQAAPAGGFADIADRITPAVVTIFVYRDVPAHGRTQLPPQFDRFMPEPPSVVRGSGSGFVISEDGYIITNNHVVENASRIEVELNDRRMFRDVRLVGGDATTDVALLRVEADGLTAAPLGRSATARVGDWVLAVGSPGFSPSRDPLTTTVTAGIISAKGRSIGIIGQEMARRLGTNMAIEDFIQTDAAINPGNSGGPLVNVNGEVIGVNAAIASRTGTNEGYGFAVPIDLVREVVEDLVEHGTVRRALLGVSINPVDDPIARDYGLPRVSGAQVMGVSEGSAAARAGFEVGDVIVSVDGADVESVNDLQRKIRSYEPGERVSVQVIRYGRDRKTLQVTLDEAESTEQLAQAGGTARAAMDPLGIRVEELDARARRALDLPDGLSGVLIVDMDEAGPFVARWSLISRSENAVILSVNRKAVESVGQYQRALGEAKPGDVVSLMVWDPQAGTRVPLSVPLQASLR